MTWVAYALAAGVILAGFLVILAALIQKPGEPLPQRPLPYPNRAPGWVAGKAPMVREGRHHADDRDAETTRLTRPEPTTYHDPR